MEKNSPAQDLEAPLIPGNPEKENAVDMENNSPAQDLEAAASTPLIPGSDLDATDSGKKNALQWTFIRKVYAVLIFQMILTVGVGSVVVFVSPVALFFASSSWLVWGLRIVLVVLLFILLCSLSSHPNNFILLALFTTTISLAVGLMCAQGDASICHMKFCDGKVILESVVLTTAVVVSLTVYTFWAARRGHDFSFPGLFWFSAVIILTVFVLIRVYFPLGKFSVMIYGVLGSLIFSGYIIRHTDNLIKSDKYDEYIWASVTMYLDVIKFCWADKE